MFPFLALKHIARSSHVVHIGSDQLGGLSQALVPPQGISSQLLAPTPQTERYAFLAHLLDSLTQRSAAWLQKEFALPKQPWRVLDLPPPVPSPSDALSLL